MGIQNRTLFAALDNLHVMRGVDSESVDLIATDPPFNTKRVFNAPLGSKAAGQRFSDRWVWDGITTAWYRLYSDGHQAVKEVIEAAATIEGGSVDYDSRTIRTKGRKNSIAAYLCWMAPRLIEMRRILRPTGSLYLHCDDAADAYLRLLLDAIFGRSAFRNAITWKRTGGNNATGNRCGRNTDTILFYAMPNAVWNDDVRHALSEKELKRYRRDADGRLYKCDPLTAPEGKPETWRGAHSKTGWRHTLARREQMLADGLIVMKRDGTPRLDGRKRYLDESGGGQKLQALWADIGRVPNTAAERTGWATQKPLALYDRIIRASSNPGDLVFDPFAGCSTTPLAAEDAGRRWMGCDVDGKAGEVLLERWAKRDGEPVIRGTIPRRTDIPRVSKGERRAALYERQNGRCANPYCDSTALREVDLEVDHELPKSRGGSNDLANLLGLCSNCNRRKSKKPWDRFLDDYRASMPHPPKAC